MKTAIPFLIIILLSLGSCKKSTDQVSEIPQPTQITRTQEVLISNYTSGVLGVQDKIIVKFTEAFPSLPKEGDYFSFEPSLKGKASFINKSTLIFEPSEEMIRGQNYLAKLNLKDLFSTLEGDDQFFEFTFSIARLSFNVSVNGLEWDKTEDNTYKLEGDVFTSDFIKGALIEKCISIEPKGLTVVWDHNENTKSSKFTISGIKRGKKQKEIKRNKKRT